MWSSAFLIEHCKCSIDSVVQYLHAHNLRKTLTPSQTLASIGTCLHPQLVGDRKVVLAQVLQQSPFPEMVGSFGFFESSSSAGDPEFRNQKADDFGCFAHHVATLAQIQAAALIEFLPTEYGLLEYQEISGDGLLGNQAVKSMVPSGLYPLLLSNLQDAAWGPRNMIYLAGFLHLHGNQLCLCFLMEDRLCKLFVQWPSLCVPT